MKGNKKGGTGSPAVIGPHPSSACPDTMDTRDSHRQTELSLQTVTLEITTVVLLILPCTTLTHTTYVVQDCYNLNFGPMTLVAMTLVAMTLKSMT